MQLIYETKEIQTSKQEKLVKKAIEFLKENRVKKSETFLAIKVSEESSYGAYFGSDVSPVDAYVQSGAKREKVFFAEALNSKAMISFIKSLSDENIYLFKVKYKEFTMQKISSFYAGEYEDVEVLIYDAHEEESEKGKMLTLFGEDSSPLPLSAYMQLDDSV